MKQSSSIAAGWILAAACVAGVPGCGGSPAVPWDGIVHISGSVRDFRTNAAIASAVVSVAGATATTDASGAYALAVESGPLQPVAINGESISPITLKDPTYRGDFFVHTTGCVARYGTVVDILTRKPLAGAAVTASGLTAVTDQAGWFRTTEDCTQSCIGFNTTFVKVTYPGYTDGQFPGGRGLCNVNRVDYEMSRP